MNEIRPLKTNEDYESALERIEKLWGAAEGTAEGDTLEVLVTLVEAYELDHHPIGPPDPVDAITFHMAQNNLEAKDLATVLRSQPRASEVLRRKRQLSIDMIRRLHEMWGLPLASLFGSTKPKRETRTTRAQRTRLGRTTATTAKR